MPTPIIFKHPDGSWNLRTRIEPDGMAYLASFYGPETLAKVVKAARSVAPMDGGPAYAVFEADAAYHWPVSIIAAVTINGEVIWQAWSHSGDGGQGPVQYEADLAQLNGQAVASEHFVVENDYEGN
jgi:hypothetical protein